jgi:uncharacterized protein YhfF
MKGRGRVVRMIWALLRSTEYDGRVRFGRCRRRGALAQLVERFVRNEKVRGSTPLGSTLQSSSTTVERVTSPTDSALRSFWERARAVLEATDVVIVPFDQVGEDHARSEGEGDRTLRAWREIHERYWRDHSENPCGFEPTMPVVCERFRLLHAEPAGRAS